MNEEMQETHILLDAKLEALLFYKGEPTRKSDIKKILDIDETELQHAIQALKERLSQGGLCLVEHTDKISLGTAPSASRLIEQVTREELTKDLGRAGLETLSIVLYKGPVSRKEIDHIRGVNSSFILRNLLVRGLVDRNTEQGGRYTYSASIDLLMHLGISQLEDLPDFSKIKQELENFGSEEHNKNTD